MNRQTRRNGDLPRAQILSRAQTVTRLQAVGRAIVQTFGPDLCEVLIHDLSDLEHSIIWIEGDVTHRRAGDTMTDLGLACIRAGQFDDLFGYRTSLDGNTLRSSSVFLRDGNEQPWGAFCINLNITPLLQMRGFLESWTAPEQTGGIRETFSHSIEEVIEGMIADWANQLGKSVSDMSRAERIELVRALEQNGALQVRRAVPIMAKCLGTSRFTIYNYLADARGKSDTDDRSATVIRRPAKSGTRGQVLRKKTQ